MSPQEQRCPFRGNSIQEASGPTRQGKPPRVVIVGAGIGGLTLAQGLRKAGVSVAVYEQDTASGLRHQGYRVPLHPPSLHALEQTLPADHLGWLRASLQEWKPSRTVSERLETLLLSTAAISGKRESSYSIDRLTLHRLLSAGLEDAVHHGKVFERYEERDTGEVRVHFADGSSVVADVLVGADGTTSRVRRQLLPQHAEQLDTGYRELTGRMLLTPDTRREIEAVGLESQVLVLDKASAMLVLSRQEFRAGAAHACAAPGPGADLPPDHVAWGLIAPTAHFARAGDGERVDVGVLKQIAFETARTWHPALRRMIERTPPSHLGLNPLRTAVPHAHWGTRPVTLLGDAVHGMVPPREHGATITLRDALLLAQRLIGVSEGEKSVIAALQAYETEMLPYAFKAVSESHATLKQMMEGSRFARGAVHQALKAMNGLLGAASRVLPASAPRN
ncbi:FAD-dependent oxidoreductase [Melittangium boletus]|uniref:FAD-dependent oxidoreductase n=1 Tax=Melittangium boletus TaxID=83453 RepID=UPI003DA34B8A